MGGHEQLQGKRTDHLSFRIQLLEGLFLKYTNVVECRVPVRHSCDNTVPCLTDTFYKQDSAF
jgi:hypothetical protein